jgi:hypothetical protein
MTPPVHPRRDLDPSSLGSSLLAAAMLLPGVQAQAAGPPENGSISLRYLEYADRQPGLERTHVHSPSISVSAPVASEWAIDATLTVDDVSGATPRYHTAISGASSMHDVRKAADLGVTHYFRRGTFTAGAAYSTEHDYVSRTLSLNGTLSSENNNVTWAFGVAGSADSINPVNHRVVDEHRRTTSLLAGVTEVLSTDDIGQITFVHSNGTGYFSDPYKLFDNRPRARRENSVLLRWNHYLDSTAGTARLSYRWYDDSFGIRAHTLSGQYVQPLSGGWSVVPELRLYTQSAAYFYFDPVYDSVLGAPFPPGYLAAGSASRLSSPDQRLSGFGAVTAAFKVVLAINRRWTVDVKVEHHEQRGSWRPFHRGSQGLAPLSASFLQVGLTRQW